MAVMEPYDPYAQDPATPPTPPMREPTTTDPPPPATTTPPPTTTPDPWATAPTDGNWQAWFMRNVQGTAATPAALAALEAKLKLHGISILTNAQGVAGKIKLPDGKIIDVGRAFSSGNPSQMGWQWLTGETTTPGGQAVTIDPSYLEPFMEEFATPENAQTQGEFKHADFTAPDPFSYGAFQSPDAESLARDPGFQFRLDRGRDMLETSAAARGLLNSGGTLQDLIDYGQKAGSQEYQNVFNRDLSAWGANKENAFQGWDSKYRTSLDAYGTNLAKNSGAFSLNTGTRNENYNRAWNQYLERRNTFYSNQTNPYGKIIQAAQVGAGAAAV